MCNRHKKSGVATLWEFVRKQKDGFVLRSSLPSGKVAGTTFAARENEILGVCLAHLRESKTRKVTC